MELSLIIDLYQKSLPIQSFWVLISKVFDAPFYIMLIGLVYWSAGRKEGFRFATFVVLNNVINQSLKSLFSAARPFQKAPHVLQIKEAGYGLPSAHAQNAAMTWRYFSSHMSRILRFSTLVIVILIGLSRILLGVHYIHQVIIGLFLGYILAVLFLKVSYESLEAILVSQYTLGLVLLGLVSIEIIQSTMAFSLPAGVLNAFRQGLVLVSGYFGIMIGQRKSVEATEFPKSIARQGTRLLIGLLLTAAPLVLYALVKSQLPVHDFEVEIKCVALIGAGYIMSYQCFAVFKRLKI